VKPKNTLILFLVFITLLAAVLFFENKGNKKDDSSEKLVSFEPDEVQKIEFQAQDTKISFQKNQDSEWLMTAPLKAETDSMEVDNLLSDFSGLNFSRIVDAEPDDLKKYGLPGREVSFIFKDGAEPVVIQIGMENPLDNTFFAKRADENKIVLIPSTFKNLFEKTVFDFRKKDIFHFETDDVSKLQVKAKNGMWEAQKIEDEWWLQKPVHALAKNSNINTLLSKLSDLKAGKFAEEEKNREVLKKYSLLKPDYEISLSFPGHSQETTFYLHKNEDTVFAATSLSPIIIETENSVLDELQKKSEEYREKSIAVFYSWEVNKLQVKKGDLNITVVKDEDGIWTFQSADKAEADKEKIDNLIRELDDLEADSFIDPPVKLNKFGLEKPAGHISLWTKESDGSGKEITIQIGKTEAESGSVVVKNARFPYLFQVRSDFLEKFPEKRNDWRKEKLDSPKNEK